MALRTRAQAEADRVAERTLATARRVAKAAAHFVGMPAASANGRTVRTRVAANPEEWSVTQVACDVDTATALLMHTSGLWCPVCGTRYDRIDGLGGFCLGG